MEIGIGELIPDGMFLYSPEDSHYRESVYCYAAENTEILLDNYRWEPWYKNMRPRLR